MKFIGIFLIFFTSFNLFSKENVNQLTLYFFPSPYELNWESPQKIAQSVLKSTYIPTKFKYRHSLGHVSSELLCDDGFYHLSGMTTKEKNEDTQLILKEKVGLGVMFYPMKGKLQSRKEVEDDIQDRIKKGKMNWISIKINKTTCQRLKQDLQTYENENIQDVYGLVFNPRKKEGAGCSAFGMSLLEVAGLMTEEYKTEFSQRVFVNNDLNGFNGSVNKASFFKILLGINAKHWSKDNKNGKELFFWRPNLMYEWVKNKIKKLKERQLTTYRIETKGKLEGLSIDKTMVAAPKGPIFLN